VVSDVRMPDIGGTEFIFRLRQLYPELPVMVISAFNSPEQLKGLPFLRKPFKIEKLVEAIRRSLGDHPNV
ncbi:response regulator, partial [bacterium]|nr:response regulator [bacterium]